MRNTRIVSLLLAAASLWTTPAWSKTYPLPPADSRLIGALEDYIVQPGDHLELVGKHTRTGFLALLEANPGLTAPLDELMYLRDVVFTTGIVEAGDHFIVASGEADLACRITHVPRSAFG